MPDVFHYDVFLSYSSKDKAVVRDLAERLRKDGVKVWFDEWEIKPGDSIPSKIEEGLECSRVLVLCMSANALGPDWAQLESNTYRFRDPLNKGRCFLALCLDGAPIKSTLTQSVCINWHPACREQEYVNLYKFCLDPEVVVPESVHQAISVLQIADYSGTTSYGFFRDGKRVLSSGAACSMRLSDFASTKMLRTFEGHTGYIWTVALSNDECFALSGSRDSTVRLWDIATGRSLRVFVGHQGEVECVAWSSNQLYAVSGAHDDSAKIWNIETGECVLTLLGHSGYVSNASWDLECVRVLTASGDNTIRLWDVKTGRCLRVFEGHRESVLCVAWSPDERHFVSGSQDRTVRVWNVETGRSVLVFEGHTERVWSVAWSLDSRRLLSGSWDQSARLWDIEAGKCVANFRGHRNHVMSVAWSADEKRAFVGDNFGEIRVWDLSASLFIADQIQYTNAKALVVGDPNAGKTGLTHRLATGRWKPSEESTVGAWSTQWQLKCDNTGDDVDREIWLWDFGGQADQRLVHQLYMDRAALILLLFNADQDDVLPGLCDWQMTLRRSVKDKIPCFLVAGRIDTDFKASRGMLQAFAKEQGLAYYETSSKSGKGCEELRAAVVARIPWEQMEKRASPRIFKQIKDEILKLRDEGQVLHTYKELRELLWRRLPDEPHFTDETLQTVIGLLDGPGIVKELHYGTYILLAPEWINAYAQAVIRTLRSLENNIGVLPLRSIAEGKLIYQCIGRDGLASEMKRLPTAEERVVLGEMERQLEERGLCLRQGDKIVFPSYCGRDRPAMLEHPSVFVTYSVMGFLDDIYATLVVKLADSESFHLRELWRDAADFITLAGDHHMGLKLTRANGTHGDISVYFGKGVSQQEQVIFANYIHAHLQASCEEAQRRRHYVCPKCHAPKGIPEVLMKKLLRDKQNADTECDACGERFPLWDALEKKFASEAVRMQVELLQADDLVKLDSRRRGKLLALEVGARITSANQKCFEIPATEDEGLDMELEFTNDDGEGTGHRLYLQLKSGNSHLTRRKTDGAEIFKIKKQRWVNYWLQQPHPVMLVIGTFSETDGWAVGKEKQEFAEVRWMEVSSVLKRESENGTKTVKQIEFKGERLNLSSVRRWRDKFVVSTSS
jgi:small GTP-binding protein